MKHLIIKNPNGGDRYALPLPYTSDSKFDLFYLDSVLHNIKNDEEYRKKFYSLLRNIFSEEELPSEILNSEEWEFSYFDEDWAIYGVRLVWGRKGTKFPWDSDEDWFSLDLSSEEDLVEVWLC